MSKFNKEQRTAKREKSFLIAYLDEQKIYITDISEKGCQLSFESNIAPHEDGVDMKIKKGDIISFKVEIPEYDEKEKIIYVPIRGEVMWARLLVDFVLIGIQFNDMTQNSTDYLKKVIAYWNFLNSTFGQTSD